MHHAAASSQYFRFLPVVQSSRSASVVLPPNHEVRVPPLVSGRFVSREIITDTNGTNKSKGSANRRSQTNSSTLSWERQRSSDKEAQVHITDRAVNDSPAIAPVTSSSALSRRDPVDLTASDFPSSSTIRCALEHEASPLLADCSFRLTKRNLDCGHVDYKKHLPKRQDNTSIPPSQLTLASPTALLSSAPEWQAQFYKTKLCPVYVQDLADPETSAQYGPNIGNATGVCANGETCRFAHSFQELRPLPDLRKTKLCSSYTKRVACTNTQCPFAHSPQELRTSSSVFYKVTLCNFYRNGRCWNGPNCRFAHGNDELRSAGCEVLDEPVLCATKAPNRRVLQASDCGLLPTPTVPPPPARRLRNSNPRPGTAPTGSWSQQSAVSTADSSLAEKIASGNFLSMEEESLLFSSEASLEGCLRSDSTDTTFSVPGLYRLNGSTNLQPLSQSYFAAFDDSADKESLYSSAFEGDLCADQSCVKGFPPGLALPERSRSDLTAMMDGRATQALFSLLMSADAGCPSSFSQSTTVSQTNTPNTLTTCPSLGCPQSGSMCADEIFAAISDSFLNSQLPAASNDITGSPTTDDDTLRLLLRLVNDGALD